MSTTPQTLPKPFLYTQTFPLSPHFRPSLNDNTSKPSLSMILTTPQTLSLSISMILTTSQTLPLNDINHTLAEEARHEWHIVQCGAIDHVPLYYSSYHVAVVLFPLIALRMLYLLWHLRPFLNDINHTSDPSYLIIHVLYTKGQTVNHSHKSMMWFRQIAQLSTTISKRRKTESHRHMYTSQCMNRSKNWLTPGPQSHRVPLRQKSEMSCIQVQVRLCYLSELPSSLQTASCLSQQELGPPPCLPPFFLVLGMRTRTGMETR